MISTRRAGRCNAAWQAVFLALALALAAPAGQAAELEGVRLPDRLDFAGVALKLNGIGLRTFSLLRIGVYVGGLYLEQPSHDGEAILNSPQTKVLVLHFIRDASADRVRDAWREGFATDCVAPCHLRTGEVDRILAAVPDLHKGDVVVLAYTPDYVSVTVNGIEYGRTSDRPLMRVLLATFIGPHPPTERLKRELLGGPHE